MTKESGIPAYVAVSGILLQQNNDFLNLTHAGWQGTRQHQRKLIHYGPVLEVSFQQSEKENINEIEPASEHMHKTGNGVDPTKVKFRLHAVRPLRMERLAYVTEACIRA